VPAAVRGRAVGSLLNATSESLGHEPAAVDDGVHRRRQFTPGIRLTDIASRAGAECGFRDFPRLMLADEEDPDARIVCEDSAGSFDAVQRRETDVEQNQIRSKMRGFLDGIGSISGFADNPPASALAKRRCNVATPRFEIVNNQDPVDHDRLPSSRGRQACCAPVHIKTDSHA